MAISKDRHARIIIMRPETFTQRPDTFSQIVLVEIDSSCSSAADHTYFASRRPRGRWNIAMFALLLHGGWDTLILAALFWITPLVVLFLIVIWLVQWQTKRHPRQD